MNCKRMEMAIVTRQRHAECMCVRCQVFRAMLGKVVRVTTLVSDRDWRIEEPIVVSIVVAAGVTVTLKVIGMPDAYLTPIPALPVDEEPHDEVSA